MCQGEMGMGSGLGVGGREAQPQQAGSGKEGSEAAHEIHKYFKFNDLYFPFNG